LFTGWLCGMKLLLILDLLRNSALCQLAAIHASPYACWSLFM
jgi:hypothetical protein